MCNFILSILGLVFIVLLIGAGISAIIGYFKYKENHKDLEKFWDDTTGEFYFKFFSVGWKIKNDRREVLTEKEFSL